MKLNTTHSNRNTVIVGLILSSSLLGPLAYAEPQAINEMNEKIMGVSARFVTVKAGTFPMGDPDRKADGTTTISGFHLVTLTQDYEIQATEVTQRQYENIMHRNPSFFSEKIYCPKSYDHLDKTCSDYPVENVNWYDINGFINELNNRDEKYSYRLPTEAEWEFALRDGRTDRQDAVYSVQSASEIKEFAWCGENSVAKNLPAKRNWEMGLPSNYRGRTHRVASKKPSPLLGLYDMVGNVSERVQDLFGPPANDGTSLTDPLGDHRPVRNDWHVERGTSWFNLAKNSLVPYGSAWASTVEHSKTTGFRLVRFLKRKK